MTLFDHASDLDQFLAYLLVLLLVATILLVVSIRHYARRSREANIIRLRQNMRLALILKTGRLRVWHYIPASRHYFFLSESGDNEQEYNPIEFSQLFAAEDFELMHTIIFDLCEGKREAAKVTLHSRSEDPKERRIFEVSLSVSTRDRQGAVAAVIGIQHDITEETLKQQHANELLMRYQNVFNTSLLDMLYYDEHGVLRDINERACQAFGVKDRDMVLRGNFLLQNNPFFDKVDLDQLQDTRTSSLVDFADYTDPCYRLDEFGLKGKIYYESTINPIRDASGRLEGIYMAGREITEMVESYHRQREGVRQLYQATEAIRQYIQNINYALRVSGVRLVNYYPRSYTLELSDNISETQLRLSQLRCIRLATIRFRRNVSSVLNRMDHLTSYPIEQIIETEFRDAKGRQIWLLFNMVPMRSADGRVERYFGLCRNMTDMVETEQKLAVETKKAQETELLKQAFLTNMSYEIRTPLNTVVGFAELLERDHDPADEPSFVEQIKKSSNTLLLLINDILFLSRLDANMIEFNRADIDFALFFESHCHMGLSRIAPNVQVNIENPYNSLVVSIDEGNVGLVIQRLCGLAAFFVREGSVSARYEYRRGELTITIEDTGVGIDPETLPHVFDRFVRNRQEELCGTGLDLPIVQSLVQQMGGSIELDSELNKGTTVYVSLPCEAKVVDKRRDNSSSSNLLEQQLFL